MSLPIPAFQCLPLLKAGTGGEGWGIADGLDGALEPSRITGVGGAFVETESAGLFSRIF